MKKYVIVLSLIVFIVGSWQGVGADQLYLVGTKEQLIAFAQAVSSGETKANARLTADIDLENESWTPIANFEGVFDGDGYVIKNLNINASSNDKGFFAKTNEAEIKNLGIESGTIHTRNGERVGAIVGNAIKTNFTNCFNGADVYADWNAGSYGNGKGVGGIAGRGENSTFVNCYNYGTIGHTALPTERQGNAGIVFFGVGSTKLENCYNYGTILGSEEYALARPANVTATNSYYSQNCGQNDTLGTAKPQEAFENGEIAYLMGEAFGQKVGIDPLPVFLTADNKVSYDGQNYYNEAAITSVKSILFKGLDGSISNEASVYTKSIIITFSGILVEASLENAVSLKQNGDAVAYTGSLQAAESTYTIVLDDLLKSDGEYVLTILGSIENSFGNTMGNDYVLEFKVAYVSDDAILGFKIMSNGEEVTDFSEASSPITVEVSMYKTEGVEKDMTIAFCAYEFNEESQGFKLVGHRYKAVTISEDESGLLTYSADIEVENTEGADVLKFFLWDYPTLKLLTNEIVLWSN